MLLVVLLVVLLVALLVVLLVALPVDLEGLRLRTGRLQLRTGWVTPCLLREQSSHCIVNSLNLLIMFFLIERISISFSLVIQVEHWLCFHS